MNDKPLRRRLLSLSAAAILAVTQMPALALPIHATDAENPTTDSGLFDSDLAAQLGVDLGQSDEELQASYAKDSQPGNSPIGKSMYEQVHYAEIVNILPDFNVAEIWGVGTGYATPVPVQKKDENGNAITENIAPPVQESKKDRMDSNNQILGKDTLQVITETGDFDFADGFNRENGMVLVYAKANGIYMKLVNPMGCLYGATEGIGDEILLTKMDCAAASTPIILNSMAVSTGDYDGDGVDEIAALSEGTVKIYNIADGVSSDAWQKSANWSVSQTLTFASRECQYAEEHCFTATGLYAPNMFSLASGDLDNDGVDDLAVTECFTKMLVQGGYIVQSNDNDDAVECAQAVGGVVAHSLSMLHSYAGSMGDGKLTEKASKQLLYFRAGVAIGKYSGDEGSGNMIVTVGTGWAGGDIDSA